jgi:hypothetical protein
VKEFLSLEGHAFVAKDVEEDSAAYAELIALGFRLVPLTVVGPHRIKGFDLERLRAALADAGS